MNRADAAGDVATPVEVVEVAVRGGVAVMDENAGPEEEEVVMVGGTR